MNCNMQVKNFAHVSYPVLQPQVNTLTFSIFCLLEQNQPRSQGLSSYRLGR